MNKNFIAAMAGSSVLLLTMCSSSSAFANKDETTHNPVPQIETTDLVDIIIEKTFEEEFARKLHLEQMAKLMEEKAAQEKLDATTAIMDQAIAELTQYAGKTRYVFAGSSPRGWDCSGLVLWFYAHFDIELYHSATEQMKTGTEVTTPKPGDIVAFQWNNSSRAYHVGIYIDEDTMIDAGSRISGTRFRSIEGFGGNNSTVKYIRLVDTN